MKTVCNIVWCCRLSESTTVSRGKLRAVARRSSSETRGGGTSTLNHPSTHLLSQLGVVAEAISATIGPAWCEVVVHDFRVPDSSIVAISGNVTNRSVGGSMSQIGIAMLAEGDNATARMNYIARTRDGKAVKSTTVPIRDESGAVVGVFCINIDVTQVAAVSDALRAMGTGESPPAAGITHFGNDVGEVAQVLIEETLSQLGWSVPPSSIEGCIEFVRALDKKGFFSIRKSASLLADYLGLSRATIYTYLKESHQ